jgi:hypothetical protein
MGRVSETGGGGSGTGERPPQLSGETPEAHTPVAHFLCVGIETRNEGEMELKRCGFIGEFEDFAGADAQRMGYRLDGFWISGLMGKATARWA